MPFLIVSFLVRKHDFPEKRDGQQVEKEKGKTTMTHRHGVETKNNTPFQAEMAGSTKTLSQGFQLKRQHKKTKKL